MLVQQFVVVPHQVKLQTLQSLLLRCLLNKDIHVRHTLTFEVGKTNLWVWLRLPVCLQWMDRAFHMHGLVFICLILDTRKLFSQHKCPFLYS